MICSFWYTNTECIIWFSFSCYFNFKAEAIIKKGPHEDLEGYLEAIAQLRKIIKRFTGNKNLKTSIEVISSVTNTLARATMQLDDEFKQLLAQYRFAHSGL